MGKKAKKVLVDAALLTELARLKKQEKEFAARLQGVEKLEADANKYEGLNRAYQRLQSENDALQTELGEQRSAGDGIAAQKKANEEALKHMRTKESQQKTQVRRLEKMLKVEKSQYGVLQTKMNKISAALKLSQDAKDTQFALRTEREKDLAKMTEAHREFVRESKWQCGSIDARGPTYPYHTAATPPPHRKHGHGEALRKAVLWQGRLPYVLAPCLRWSSQVWFAAMSSPLLATSPLPTL